MVKYGVIRKELLCSDLRGWDTLYTAGRLQKPVLTLLGDAEVSAANARNRQSALLTSLLLLPQRFTSQVGHGCRKFSGLLGLEQHVDFMYDQLQAGIDYHMLSCVSLCSCHPSLVPGVWFAAKG